MDATLIGAIAAAVVAIISAASACITAQSTRRKATADVNATVTAMFKELCETQQATIARLEKRLADNETEIGRLRQELEDAFARAHNLQERIAKLETENVHLRAELAARRKAQQSGGGGE